MVKSSKSKKRKNRKGKGIGTKPVRSKKINASTAYDVLSTPLLMVFRAINFRLYGLTNTSGLTPIACKNSN
jgi:hypothetical protein